MTRQFLFISFLLFSTLKLFAASPPVIIGYVGGYKGLIKTGSIASRKLTHINYAFVNIKNGRAWLNNIQTDTANFRLLNELKKENPNLKILISIGGWSWSENFSDAAFSDSSRRVFAKSATEIIRRYKLDGVDIDWEYPGRPGEEGNIYRAEDKQNFTLLFQALRQELDSLESATGSKKLLTTATGGFKDFLQTTEMGKAAAYLDYINLMTYDYYSNIRAGHHTNLFASVQYHSGNDAHNTTMAYIAAGVPASKLVMGIAFYSREFLLKAGSRQGLGDTIVSQRFGKGFSFIKDSLENRNGFVKYQDKDASAPYLFNKSAQTFISYDDEWSVRQKCRYVSDHGMAGVMFWEYDSDPKEYLLNEINKIFHK